MRRRRRARPTWFPVLGTSGGEDLPSTVFATERTIGPGALAFATQTCEFTEILDDNDTSEAETASLRDRVEGKDYAITRIVGKIWAAAQQYTPVISEGELAEAVPEFIVWCAGLAILPVDSSGVPEESDTDYNPLLSANSAKSWMWRRTWTLWNNLAEAATPDPTQPLYTGPTNVANVGSGTWDAGHVDAKSRRRVRKEERLFLITGVYIGNIVDATGESVGTTNTVYSISWGYDFRVLGGMRKSHNKSILS